MSDEPKRSASTPLEDYALLSDLHTGPLVSREGSIDWLCFPRFDSPSVFAALLGDPEDGRWKLSAVDGEVVSRRYLPRTFVLETTWRTPTGTAVVTDFLPPTGARAEHPDHADLVRRVECVSGHVEIEHDLRIRFDYNRALPWTRRVEVDAEGTCGLLSIAGPDALLLTGPLLHPRKSARPHAADGAGAEHADEEPWGPSDVAQDPADDEAWGPGVAALDPADDEAWELDDGALRPAGAVREGAGAGAAAGEGAGAARDERAGAAPEAEHRAPSEGAGATPAERGTADPGEPGHPDDSEGGVSHRLGGCFRMSAGESLDWVLTWHESHHDQPVAVDPGPALDRTVSFWTDWSSRVSTRARHEQAVLRSMLVLRALTDRGTGGIVAAPTTSLPEEFGGSRNWDYRYTWLRDAALTIETLVAHDFIDGALLWRNWLLRAVAGDPDQVQVMYGVAGERQLPEAELPHLAGYENSTPVRVGNGAVGQYQADVVGEVMLALAALRDAGVEEDEYSWGLQKNLLRFCTHNFDRRGHGIWEMRGEPLFFVHGRAMMWAAFDQGVRAAEEHGLSGPVDRWRQMRDRLHAEILEHGFDEELNSFTQAYGNTEVDASLLQLPHTGFVAYDDPRMLGTVARIEQDLQDEHGFLRRYRTTARMDGLEGHEYPFLICTFWLVEQYASSGRTEDAGALLEKLVQCANDLGLYAEEYDPVSGRLAGNFPQAFSHLGFIRAVDAVVRARAEESTEARPES